ncbi:MAG: DUF4124 domain-containing protein [Pseudomonadota bacterium]|nr:DUF4124 domain-containing protein [Pseudomonadota bacterium]
MQKPIALTLALLLTSIASHGAIYQCTDDRGKTIFSDEPCSQDENAVRTVTPSVNVAPFEDRINTPPNRPRPLYRGSNVGRKTRFISVSIYEETDTYMIFEVEGYYNGPANGYAEYRVMPNIHWRARSFSSSTRGLSKGYARIELGSKAPETNISDVITLQLWQYTPGKSPRVLETQVVPFKKAWIKAP